MKRADDPVDLPREEVARARATHLERTAMVRRDVGCVVLAEFDAEGFAIIARVHEAEGRTHPVGPITFDAAVDDLRSRGFRLRSIRDAQVHRVAVLTPGE